MPTCTFCGSVNSAGDARCSLCGQELLVGEPPESDKVGWGQGGSEQAVGATTSRYDVPDAGASRQSSPGWGSTGAASEAPPPGWGTAGSSSWGTQQSRQVARISDDTGKKKRRQRSGSKGSRRVFAQIRLIVIVLIVGGVLIYGAKSQLGSESIQFAMVTNSDTPITGKFEVLDQNESVVGDTEIGDPGSRCGAGRLSNFKVKVSSSESYLFRWNGLTAGPIDASSIKANGNHVTINYSKSFEATLDRPRSCL